VLALAASLFGFLAVLLGALAVRELRVERAPADRRAQALRSPRGPSREPVILRQLSEIPALRSFLANHPWTERASSDLERANVHLRVGEYLLARASLAVLLPLVGLIVIGFGVPGLLLSVPLGVLGFMLPAFYVHMLKRRRLRAIEGQLVEMLTLLSNSVRSGFSFLQGTKSAASQMSPPMSEELEHMIHDTNVGVGTEQALLDMGRRVGSYNLDMAITAIVIQRTTGGNLSEILDNVAETIRERERIQGEINTLTAEKRMSGNILSVYPTLLAVVMFLIRPSLMSVLISEPAGWVLLAVALTFQVTGFLVIRRIVSIDI
jgi:tight adherence protein B